jgi:hypothetical protein
MVAFASGAATRATPIVATATKLNLNRLIRVATFLSLSAPSRAYDQFTTQGQYHPNFLPFLHPISLHHTSPHHRAGTVARSEIQTEQSIRQSWNSEQKQFEGAAF